MQKFLFHLQKVSLKQFICAYVKELNQNKFPITIKESLENNKIDSTVELQIENANEILFIAVAKPPKKKLGDYTCFV